MSFTLTNDELNILYLNGITDESIQSDIAFKYGNDMSDEDIYAGYKDMIDKLRPITKTSINDTKNINEWKSKGGISAFEYGQRNSILYDNIKGEEAPADYAARLIGTAAEQADKVVSKYAPQFGLATKLIGGIARNRTLHENSDGITGKNNKIDFGESLGNSIRSGEWLPFIGGFLSEDGLDAKRERTLREKITNGESIYQSDLDFLNYRINKRQEENVRQYTIGGQIADSFLPSLVRFGGEIATGTFVLESLGFAARVAETASAGQKVAHGLGNMLFSGAVNTVLPSGWNDIYEAYQGRMLDNETKLYSLTDKGEALFNESFEKPATAFLKSLGQTFIMFSSEASGELLGLAGRAIANPVGKYVATPISEYLKQNKQLMKFTDKAIPALSKMYEKLQGLPVVGKSYDWLASRVKFDGFLEEMGEEVLEDFLNLTLGTNNEERSLENYAKVFFKSPDEWAILAGAIALQGGTLSVASHLIGSEMEANGAESAEIIEALRGLSELEKEEVIFNKIQTGELNIDELSISNKVTNNIKDELRTNAINNGVREDLAEKVANLATNMLITRADDNDVDVEDIYKEFAPKVQYNDDNITLVGGIEKNNNSLENIDLAIIDEKINKLSELLNDENLSAERSQSLIDDMRILGALKEGNSQSLTDTDYNRAQKLIEGTEVFQSANTAGAETSAEISDAKKEWQEKGTDSKYFKKWLKKSKVVDEDGRPLIVYRGDVATFAIFLKDKASPEGDMGAGFYFSSSEDDVDSNYYDGGPDFDNKVARLAKQIQYDKEEEGEEIDYDEAKELAEQQLRGEPQKLEVYLSIQNPCYVGTNETWLLSDLLDSVDINEEDYEDYDEYEQARDEAVAEALDEAIYDVENNLDDLIEYENVEKVKSILYESSYDGGITLARLKERLAEEYIEDFEGNLVSNEIARRVVKALGYDGIIDDTVSDKFKGMYLEPDTTHYIVFDSEQIKSVDNQGTFDEGNANIYYQTDIKKEAKSNSTLVDTGYANAKSLNLISASNNNIEQNSEVVNSLKEKQNQLNSILEFGSIIDYGEKYKKEIEQTLLNKKRDELEDECPDYTETDINEELADYEKSYEFTSEVENEYLEKENEVEKQAREYVEELANFIAKVCEQNGFYTSINHSKQSISTYINIYDSQDTIEDKDNPNFVIRISDHDNGYGDKDVMIYLYDSIDEVVNKVGSTLFNSSNNNKVFYQLAYHGTKVRGLENTGFDLSYALSGEGAMAHGYGVYTAKNKDVSEGYMKNLSSKKWYYEGQELNAVEASKVKTLYKWGVNNKTLEYLTMRLKNTQEEFDKLKNKPRKEWTEDDISKYSSLESEIEDYKKDIKFVEEFDASKVDEKEEGQLYEVDIPDDDVLLDEDLMFSEQPEKVQAAIKQICEDYADNNKLVDLNVIAYTNNTSEQYKNNTSYKEGRNIYDIISNAFGGDREASLLLNKYGVKGIKYNGHQDGECYVVFDDKAVQVLNTYYQEEQQSIFDDINKIREAHVKGSYIPVQNLINLFKTADDSTIVHELGHWYLNSLQEDAARGSEKAQDKLDAVRKFVKNDGEDFTLAQHEKFARGFEAYIRSGYAKTKRLRNVFEDFKNSLLKIYDDIKDMFWYDENGNEQHFTEEDLNRINPLFERLMSTENERIQATVFNRIAQLNEEKEKIKEKQYEELNELEDMYNNNLLEGARKEKNKQLTQEFLTKAEQYANKESKESKDYKKRFKDVTLQILSSATGKSKQWIANSRNWNKLQEMIETSDGLSSGNGFLKEWSEFYTYTNLSDNSNEAVGREEDFLQSVYDRLVSSNYESNEDYILNEYYKYYGEELEKAETWKKQFDYLYGKLTSVKLEEKQACFDAIFDLFTNIPLTSTEDAQDCLAKLQEAEQYLSEKLGSIDKSAARKNKPLSMQFKMYILQKIGNQKVYDPETNRQVNITNTPRLNGITSRVTSLTEAQNAIRLINNFMIEQIENKQKSILHKEIQKQIKINSQSIKVGALRKGKFDWRINSIFAILQELNKTPVEEIQKQLGIIAKIDTMADNEQREVVNENTETSGSLAVEDEQEKLRLAFLEYKSKKVNELNVHQATRLLEGILKLKFEGRRAKDASELARALETYKTKTNIAEIITKKLSNNKFAKYLARWIGGDTIFTSEGTLANWESLLNAIADKNVAQEFSLLWDEANAEIYANKKMIELNKIISQVYGFEKSKGLKKVWNKALDFNEYQEIVKLFREYEEPKNTYTLKIASWNRHTLDVSYSDLDINRSQAMMYFGWAQNKQLRERLVNMFGENQLEYLFSQLSREDKNLMYRLIDFCDSMYEDTNEVFINITGLSLPKVENYLPSRAERVLSEVDMLQEGIQNSSVSNFSAVKQRKNCSKIKMKAVTPLQVLVPHINKTARYVVLAEKMNYYKKIFIDAPEIKDALVNVFKNNTLTNNLPINYDYINFEGDKTKQIKLYENKDIKVDKIDAITLDPILPFKVSEKPSDNKHNLINALGLKNGKVKQVTNNYTGDTVGISKSTIEKSVSNKVSNGIERSHFVNIIYNIEYLFENSQKILSHDSYKGESDIRIDRYANVAEIDDKQYLLEFIVKNGEEVKLYSVDAIDKKEATPTNAYVVNDQSALDAANNSITYIQNFIKSRLVEKYNEDYKDSLKASKKPKKARKDKGKETGEELYKMLVNQLSCSMFDNYAKSICTAQSLFNSVSSNWISASIGGNLKVLLSQLPAMINYSEYMPFGKWAVGMKDASANANETFKYMFDNWDYLKARIAGNSKDEVLSQIASDYGKFKYFRSFSTANTRWGDVMTLCLGGKPYVDYLMNEQGLSKEEAFKKLTEHTLRTQTSGHNSATSLWQKKQAQHWLARMFFAFRNADMQYERKFIDALSQYSKGDISKKELTKAILLYKVFNPLLFSAVVSDLTIFSFLRGMFCGDDDDAQNELVNMLSTVMLSNLNGYGAMGTFANILSKLVISRGITGDYVYKPKVPLLGEMLDISDKMISKEELTTTEVITSLATLGNYAAGGLPTKRFLTMATGIADVAKGDIGAGLLELIGYGRGTAYNVTTGERPPKQ